MRFVTALFARALDRRAGQRIRLEGSADFYGKQPRCCVAGGEESKVVGAGFRECARVAGNHDDRNVGRDFARSVAGGNNVH